jgi:hypothetical protein
VAVSGRRLREVASPTSTRSFALWFGVLGPPLAWASHLLLGDGLYELGCSPGFARPRIYGLPLHFWAFLMVGLFLGIDVLAGVLAFRAFRAIRSRRLQAGPGPEAGIEDEPGPGARIEDEPAPGGGILAPGEKRETVRDRAYGMAVAGVASAFLYGLLLVYGLLPPFFLRTCAISI